MNDPLGRIEALEQEQVQFKKDMREVHQNETFLIGLVKEINRDVKSVGLQVMAMERSITDLSGEVSVMGDKFEKRFEALESKLDQILRRLPEKGESRTPG